jgi:hypothetical protein
VSHNRPLTYSAAYSAFKSFIAWGGGGGLDPSLYGLPRSGATTEAFSLGIEPHVIDLKGQWKSPFTKFTYIRFTDEEIVERSNRSIPY